MIYRTDSLLRGRSLRFDTTDGSHKSITNYIIIQDEDYCKYNSRDGSYSDRSEIDTV